MGDEIGTTRNARGRDKKNIFDKIMGIWVSLDGEFLD